MQISAKSKKHPEPINIEYAMPEKLADLVKSFGEAVVESAARGSLVITIQAAMRRLLEKGKSAKEIQDQLATWKPGVREVSKASAFEKATSQIGKLSPEERKALMDKLKQMG